MPGLVRGLLLLVLLIAWPLTSRAEGRLVDFELRSPHLEQNRLGLSPVRKVTAYLPEGYDRSTVRYPVIYFLPNLFEDNRTLFDQQGAKAVFDQTISKGVIAPVIVVAADFSTPAGSSFYANSPVTGDWTAFLT